ncbi:riboflavin kinase [Candidatus Uhrbacteria bacterium]|nr:riboflavin kinase [Candidatus Uhrbacteria bacterium]
MEATLPWHYRARVISGHGLGRKIGSPTLNLVLKDPHAPNGIFVGLVMIGQHGYPAVVHVGPRPAIHDSRPVVEAHLLTTPPSGTLSVVRVMVLHRLRSVRMFATLPALRRQIQKDIALAREWWRL